MTFSSEVKAEICRHKDTDRHCMRAELSAILYTAAEWSTDTPVIILRTGNGFLFKKFFTLMQEAFNMEQAVKNVSADEREYCALIDREASVYTILQAAGLIRWADGKWKKCDTPDARITQQSDDCRAFIRGTFLSCGSVNDPQKTYHLEFCFLNHEKAVYFKTLLSRFDIEARVLGRQRGARTMAVVYLKDSEQIADVLNVMGTHQSLLKLENIRVVKNVREQVNRQVNCEAANLEKTVSASVRQVEDIRLIDEKIGLENLDPLLFETAQARLENEDMSLRELSIMLGVGKSGVNHRFRKLAQIADQLRENDS